MHVIRNIFRIQISTQCYVLTLAISGTNLVCGISLLSFLHLSELAQGKYRLGIDIVSQNL